MRQNSTRTKLTEFDNPYNDEIIENSEFFLSQNNDRGIRSVIYMYIVKNILQF